MVFEELQGASVGGTMARWLFGRETTSFGFLIQQNYLIGNMCFPITEKNKKVACKGGSWGVKQDGRCLSVEQGRGFLLVSGDLPSLRASSLPQCCAHEDSDARLQHGSGWWSTLQLYSTALRALRGVLT